MVSDEALKKLQEQIAAWPMERRFVVQQLIEDYRRNREDLRAYKATGLTPEEVLPKDKADEIALKLMRLADLESLCSYTSLRELAEADKDGRVVVLPCKVGDTVWTNTSIQGDRYRLSDRPYRVKVIFIGIGPEASFFHVEYSNGRIFPVDKNQFGKTVFLTREEAEKALEARNDNG